MEDDYDYYYFKTVKQQRTKGKETIQGMINRI